MARMKKPFGPSLYFASDKVIFDAMNHSQVTTDAIRELLAERGIVVSPKTAKYELAQYFSRLTADFFDHQNIAVKLGKAARRERITYAEISEPLTQAEIISAVSAVKEDLEALGNTVDVNVKDGRILLLLQYEFIDYTEVEFRQVQARDGVIEFLQDSTGKYAVRSTQNSEIDIAVDQVFTAINAQRPAPVKQDRISLEGVADPAMRCKFFEELVQGIDHHNFVTVTEAFCYKPKVNVISTEEDHDSKELEDQPNVVRVTLKGTGVTKSFVIGDLYAKGYYIVKVVWRVKPKKSLDADVFELEAQFGEPVTCTNFSYQARTAILFEDGKLTEKKRTPKIDEQDAIFRLIEAAAKKAYSQLV
jgi:hypothetical protein